MKYSECMRYENFNIMPIIGNNKYGIPEIKAEQYTGVSEWVAVEPGLRERPKNAGLHFFADDYRFQRLWNNPNRYIVKLQSFKCVASPDFSTYTNYPLALQIYNHYKKHWLGAYWQSMGIKVIPTISWSDESSFDWCFDGEPKNAPVIVSSVGCCMSESNKSAFLSGFRAMMDTLKPSKVIFFGNPIIPNGWRKETEYEFHAHYMNEYLNSIKTELKKEA